jgi:predicted MFS family arabinose efflux permease
MWSIVVFGLAYGTLAIAQSNSYSIWVWISALCAGLGHGMGFPLCTSLVISHSPPESRGSAISMFTGLWDLMGVLFLPLVGWISDLWGLTWMLGMMSGLAVGILVVWLYLKKHLA